MNNPITLHRVDIEALWADGDPPLGWLSAAERAAFDRLRLPKRRRDWLAGRYAAKWAVRAQMEAASIPWDRIEILSVPDGPEQGRPRVFIHGETAAVDVSISHSGRVAVACAVAQPGLRVGIDVEQITDREESFEALALTLEERRAVEYVAEHGGARAPAVTQYWALKEALVKATGTGLRARLTDLAIAAALRGAAPIFHPATGQALRVAGWGAQRQDETVYAWVALAEAA